MNNSKGRLVGVAVAALLILSLMEVIMPVRASGGVVQTKECDNGGGGGAVTCAYTSNVTAGNILVLVAMFTNTAAVTCAGFSSITDTQSSTWFWGPGTCDSNKNGDTRASGVVMIYAVAGSSAAESTTYTAAGIGFGGGLTINLYELSGVSALVQGICAVGGGTALATASVSFTAGDVEIAGLSNSQGGAYTAGASYTLQTAGTFNYQNSEYSTSVSSPTTYPATAANAGSWSDCGADFGNPSTTTTTTVTSTTTSTTTVTSTTTTTTTFTTTVTSTSTLTTTQIVVDNKAVLSTGIIAAILICLVTIVVFAARKR